MIGLPIVNAPEYDLWYDANSVGADLVVETWISHGPRSSDPLFDPHAGEWLLAGDDEEPPCRARVTRRVANRVSVQLDLGVVSSARPGRRPNATELPDRAPRAYGVGCAGDVA